MDRFDALQAFVRVVEAGSFTKAALTLHMSKTTVTQLVQQLEARLGARLLHRTTRQVTVTTEGAAYYERIVRVLSDLEEADTGLAGGSGAPSGRLRVDVPSPFARLVLMPALPDFHRRYPGIQLDMGVSDRVVDVIGDNVDCVLRGGEVTVPSLIARRVGDLQLGVYAAPDYLRRAGTPGHPSELEGTHAPHRRFPALQQRQGGDDADAARRRSNGRNSAGARPPCRLGRRRQRLSGGWPGRHGRALAAALHGRAACGARGAAAAVRRLAHRAHADVPGLPADPPRQPQAARLHGLDR